MVLPIQTKLDQLKIQTASIKKSLVLTSRKLKSLIWTLASLEKTVSLGRLHTRPFQWYLKFLWNYPQLLDKKIQVTWGAHKNEMALSGLTSWQETQLHINMLELKAVLVALMPRSHCGDV